MRTMASRTGWSARERAARARLARLLHDEIVVCGSLVTMARTCGKPTCKCARGERHRGVALAIRRGGRRVMIHVPHAWEGTVRAWVAHYQESKALLGAISEAAVERLVRAKARR